MSSLEEERQSILARMQVSREHYRRMLLNQPELHANPAHPAGHHASYALAGPGFPRSKALRWVAEHPLMTAAAAATVLALVSSRVARGAAKNTVRSGNPAAAPLPRTASNIDAIVRLLTTVANLATLIPPRVPPGVPPHVPPR
ncbi:hypothetical protein [Noviherbaspirillum sp. UKPF54]|uniref:hypothetical protein n=1 Tax=Noviherbaspirillum sp. UKPF54 TaxID=2601898 RepID=UPI0011B16EBB|nr:hypothetical protein [Noviherbaspirillum sp. UKPF54]QDZ27073.1 hypothetical protein FAY22_03300 [Noviherbaspirillum sp. UKPF54]